MLGVDTMKQSYFGLTLVLAYSALVGCKSSTQTTEDKSTDPKHGEHASHAAASAQFIPSPSPLQVPTLEPKQGREIGFAFEAFLSPHQEGAEEEDTPSGTPAMFRSTAPSVSRAKRDEEGHRGHGMVRFTKDLSRAYVDVKIEGVDISKINMFHIHCGKPGILGPILIDLARATDLQKDFADGVISVELRNEHIVNPTAREGVVAFSTQGCIIPSPSLGSLAPTKVVTIAGVAQLAMENELYFNLHTTRQTFYGDIRGQLYRVEKQQ